jgi:hypothetical protein
MRGDPIFAKYCASLETLHLNKVERQSLAQNALQALLRHVGKSILVGEGSGGAASWLATDVEPDLVAGAIVLEPPGPPFGTACPKERNPYREYTPFIQYEEGTRIYGLTDIPLTYDPPAHPHGGYDHPEKNPLDITQLTSPDGKSECFVQSPKPRKLINIKKVPNAVVTAHASSHGMYDWATVVFMLQAGVKCDLIKLEEKNILGNGHLMFLETNSNEIAQVLMDWISENAIPASFQKLVSEPTPPPEFSEFVDTVERLSPQREASVESISSRKTQSLDSQSMDQEMSLVRLPETPQPLCELEIDLTNPSLRANIRLETPTREPLCHLDRQPSVLVTMPILLIHLQRWLMIRNDDESFSLLGCPLRHQHLLQSYLLRRALTRHNPRKLVKFHHSRSRPRRKRSLFTIFLY